MISFLLLYQSRYDLLNLRLQVQQQNIIAIQEVINQKKSSAITKSSRTSSATAKKLCKMITFKRT